MLAKCLFPILNSSICFLIKSSVYDSCLEAWTFFFVVTTVVCISFDSWNLVPVCQPTAEAVQYPGLWQRLALTAGVNQRESTRPQDTQGAAMLAVRNILAGAGSLASRPAGLRPGPWEMQLSKLASEERRLTMDNTGKVPRKLSSSVPGSDVTG